MTDRHSTEPIDHIHVSAHEYHNDCGDCRHNLTAPLDYCTTHAKLTKPSEIGDMEYGTTIGRRATTND